ncbi:MAG: hypothetical protein KatS3mg008_0877 [Acidimicrobiales bacterium]|nr:MAG: hypothetical protein KatS3mg008_0877 [Acidimicrobiales bacterium]
MEIRRTHSEEGSPGADTAESSPHRNNVIRLLSRGEIEIRERLGRSSNATFRVVVHSGDASLDAVYKPVSGERPLWDFPRGLHRREAAAFELSCHLGWAVVPETVVRHEAPLGEGSLQRWVDAEQNVDFFSLPPRGDTGRALRLICAFDLVANNADRKAGHVLWDRSGRVWAIDNALCFHPHPKLRTVIWDFAGEVLPPEVTSSLERLLKSGPPDALTQLLSRTELDLTMERAARLLDLGRFPHDPTGDHLPWPLV